MKGQYSAGMHHSGLVQTEETNRKQYELNSDNSSFFCSIEERDRQLPQALIIGNMKAGTRAIIDFLTGLNPKIRQPDSGEVHFFDRNINYRKGFDFYRSFMPLSCPGDVTIEKSPSYFRDPFTAQRVFKWNKEMCIILSLRDPIARAVSDYHEIRDKNRAKILSDHVLFQKFTFDELAVREDGTVERFFPPLERSITSGRLKHWLTYFTLDQILVVDADDFSHNNPATQLNQIEAHLGLKPEIKSDMFVWNETKGFYCIKSRPCLNERKGHVYPPLRNGTIAALQEFFRPDVYILSNLLGRKLSWMDKYL